MIPYFMFLPSLNFLFYALRHNALVSKWLLKTKARPSGYSDLDQSVDIESTARCAIATGDVQQIPFKFRGTIHTNCANYF